MALAALLALTGCASGPSDFWRGVLSVCGVLVLMGVGVVIGMVLVAPRWP